MEVQHALVRPSSQQCSLMRSETCAAIVVFGSVFSAVLCCLFGCSTSWSLFVFCFSARRPQFAGYSLLQSTYETCRHLQAVCPTYDPIVSELAVAVAPAFSVADRLAGAGMIAPTPVRVVPVCVPDSGPGCFN